MWQPFDARFQNLLEKIKLDQKIVQEELQFASMGNLKTTMQNAAVREREAMLAALSTIQKKQNEQARRRYFPFLDDSKCTLQYKSHEPKLIHGSLTF